MIEYDAPFSDIAMSDITPSSDIAMSELTLTGLAGALENILGNLKNPPRLVRILCVILFFTQMHHL
jgi:hypothetical protein